MLINPLRDGLNLTAKEFVTCSPAGVLVLSSRAGVSTELGQYALSVDPLSTEQIAQQVHVALTMPEEERLARLTGMKERINENNLASWWLKFVQNIDTSGVVGFPRSKTPRLQKAQVLLVK